jgi:hypothetical protein
MQSSLDSHHFLPYPNIPLNTPFSDTLNVCSSFSVKDQDLHPYKITVKYLPNAY